MIRFNIWPQLTWLYSFFISFLQIAICRAASFHGTLWESVSSSDVRAWNNNTRKTNATNTLIGGYYWDIKVQHGKDVVINTNSYGWTIEGVA